jgi:hypothetical protein
MDGPLRQEEWLVRQHRELVDWWFPRSQKRDLGHPGFGVDLPNRTDKAPAIGVGRRKDERFLTLQCHGAKERRRPARHLIRAPCHLSALASRAVSDA